MRLRISLASLLGPLVLLASACNEPGVHQTPGSARSQPDEPTVGDEPEPVAAPGPAICGHVVYAVQAGEHGHESGHHRGVSIASLPAAGGSVKVLAEPEEGVSLFPAALAPDGHALLLLRSKPTSSGKTQDGLDLLDLDHPGTPAEVLALEIPDAQIRNPSWAPDGSFIVFESDANSFRDLYRYDLERASTLRLTDNREGNFEPAVSPAGQQVAFVSSRDGNAEVYVMSADGGDPQRLTQQAGDDTAPRWSPDGRSLAFISGRERSRGLDLFIVEASGGAARPVIARDTSVIVRDAAWSPDGRALAWTELEPKGGGAAIVIADVESGNILVRTQAEGVDEQPVWSPDAEYLVFSRGVREQANLVRMRADGSEATSLTEGPGNDWLPRWLAPASAGCAHVGPVLAPVEATREHRAKGPRSGERSGG